MLLGEPFGEGFHLENKASGIAVSMSIHFDGRRWRPVLRYSVAGSRKGRGVISTKADYLHPQVAINEGLKHMLEILSDADVTQKKVMLLWARQVNRAAWEGISDERRASMYEAEAASIMGSKKPR